MIVHWAAVLETSKYRSIVGRATVTAVSSMNQMDMDRAMPTSSNRCCLVVPGPGPSTSPRSWIPGGLTPSRGSQAIPGARCGLR